MRAIHTKETDRRDEKRERTRTRDNARCVSQSNKRHCPRIVVYSTKADALLRSGRLRGVAVAFELSRTEWHAGGGRATRGYEVGEAEPKPRRKERRKGAVSRTDGMVGSHVSARCPVSTQPTWDLPYLALPRHTMPSLPSRATLAREHSDFSFLAYSPYGRTIARR